MQTVDIDALRESVLKDISTAASSSELEQVRVAVLGKKGTLTELLRGMRDVVKEERAAFGATMNSTRTVIEEALEERKQTLARSELQAAFLADAVDVTLPGRSRPIGSEHLISRLTREIVEVFHGLGYQVVEGPEVETEYYNFTALNAPPDHPSRSPLDTFYVRDRSGAASRVLGETEVLLRPQTSPMQVRYMEQNEPPIYILVPGKVYRRDTPDTTHTPQFTQIEGLVVDKGINFSHLKGTLEHFCREIFGPDRITRFRPHFFPFTEPSAEVDVSCGVCGSNGCRFCGGTGWLEILGCGMVDPNVFGYVGIDPDVYSGFAFGMGVERIACLKYDIPDLRMLVEGDMRFLRQF